MNRLLKNIARQGLEINHGFTLIELIIVIGVLGVLAVVLLVIINPFEQIARAKDAGRKSAIAQLGKAIVGYSSFVNAGNYPSTDNLENTLIDSGELKVFPENPSGVATNCQSLEGEGAVSVKGYCYNTSIPGSGPLGAVIYTPMESTSENKKCGTGVAWYAWSALLGSSGLYCTPDSSTEPPVLLTEFANSTTSSPTDTPTPTPTDAPLTDTPTPTPTDVPPTDTPTPTSSPTPSPTPILNSYSQSSIGHVITGVNDASAGTLAWSSPANIAQDDTTRATRAVSGFAISQYLKATNFGFAIPQTAIIDGIFVEIRKLRGGGNSGEILDSKVYIVKNGTIMTTVNNSNATIWPSIEGYVSHGSSTDLWGQSWTAADINSLTFGVALAVTGSTSGSNRTASVNYMRMTIYYRN